MSSAVTRPIALLAGTALVLANGTGERHHLREGEVDVAQAGFVVTLHGRAARPFAPAYVAWYSQDLNVSPFTAPGASAIFRMLPQVCL